MSESVTAMGAPGRILLATDLGARCDRALDRAVQLAGQWQVPLLVVHALPRASFDPWPYEDEPPRLAPDPAEHVRQRILGDLRDAVADLRIHVHEGEPADVILDVAARERCDLIVLGTARDTWANSFLGSTVEHLVRRSPASVLVVKQRPRGAYRHVLVGTDFTAESRLGLATAAALFPRAEFTLLHALDIPYKSLWLDEQHRDDFARMEMATIGAFAADAELPDGLRRRMHLLVEHGHPELILRRHAQEHGADLCVIGAVRRGLAFHLLVGGSALRIVQAVPSDVLVVRGPAPPAAGPDGPAG